MALDGGSLSTFGYVNNPYYTSISQGYTISTFGYYGYDTAQTGTTGQIPYPSTPTNLIATPVTTSSIKLDWKFGRYTQWFQVYRSNNSVSGFTKIRQIYDSLTYTNTGLSQQVYYYYVIGVNTRGPSTSTSNIAHRKPLRIGKPCQLRPPQNQGISDKVNRSQSLFYNDRQYQMTKHISMQFVNHVAKQQIYYYELDQITVSSRNKIYGQTKKKIWKKPKALYRRIKRSPVQSDRKQYGFNNSYVIQAYFDKNHLDCRQVDVNYMVGNQIQWDHKSFQIKNVQYFDSVMGLSDYKITVMVTAVYTQD